MENANSHAKMYVEFLAHTAQAVKRIERRLNAVLLLLEGKCL